jgi:hypothetical protein
VLNALWDDGIVAGLSDRAFRVLGALLRLNDPVSGTLNPRTGEVHAPLSALLRMTGYSSARSVESARDELLAHPRGLLECTARDWYLALPAWQFAARRDLRTPPQILAAPAQILAGTSNKERARARQPDLEPRRIEPDQTAGGPAGRVHGRRGLAGWPELSLFGQRAFEAGDVRGVLSDLQVRPPRLDACARLDGLSVAEVMEAARGAARDATRNPVALLTTRLLLSRGVDPRGVAPASTLSAALPQDMPAGDAGKAAFLARMRAMRLNKAGGAA